MTRHVFTCNLLVPILLVRRNKPNQINPYAAVPSFYKYIIWCELWTRILINLILQMTSAKMKEEI